MAHFTRRTVILGSAVGLGGAAILRSGSAAAADRALLASSRRAHYTAGTTLESVAAKRMTTGYSRLIGGPGYPLVVRENLAKAQTGRDDTREPLASFVQFSDMHILDGQSPMRFEFLNGLVEASFRPQESLGTHGGAQLVAGVNDLKRGPFTDRPFDCVVTTGDNTDNHEHIELEWFLKVMSGGTITANTGAADRWEGVQTSGDPGWYHPDDSVADSYKRLGYPEIPGYFDQVFTPHTSPGLDVPWYCVFGNHDDSMEGVLPSWWTDFNKIYTGDLKFTGFLYNEANRALQQDLATGSTTLRGVDLATKRSTWKVTPDSRRAPFSPTEFMAEHRKAAYVGNGPVGHGFTEEAIAEDRTYYTFRIAPGITGIAMDSTNRAGWTDGSWGEAQFRWIERQLVAGSSKYYDAGGRQQTQQVDDEFFVLFSHHTFDHSFNLLRDPARPDEQRMGGWDLKNLLHRFPNVLAWVNGHMHRNMITAHWHHDPQRSWWEINSASHIDAPQLARIIEIADNKDGTLSLFTTCVESLAPLQAAYGDASQAALGSLYREFAFNNPHNRENTFGTALDWNTELLLANPAPHRRIRNASSVGLDTPPPSSGATRPTDAGATRPTVGATASTGWDGLAAGQAPKRVRKPKRRRRARRTRR